MRSLALPCALVVLTTLILAGCKSSPAPSASPGWSFSKLNPFKSSSEAPPYPATPSSLASPTSPGSPASNYAATGGAQSPSFQPGYPDASNSSLAPQVGYGQPAATASTDPLTAPQQGYFGSGTDYAAAGTSNGATTPGASPYAPSSVSNPYAALSDERYADRSFSPTSPSTPYGSPAASPYEAASDRYGNNPVTATPPSTTTAPSSTPNPYAASNPYASPNADTPPNPYASADPYGSANPYASPNPYGSSAPYSSPSPYDSGASSSSAPASSPYGTSVTAPTNSLSPYGTTTAAVNPSSPYGSDSPYGAATGNTPGGSLADTLPGDRYASAAGAATSGLPYGVSPSAYASPANPYASSGTASSGTSTNADPHFRPGSTGDYSPSSSAWGAPIPAIAYPSTGSDTALR